MPTWGPILRLPLPAVPDESHRLLASKLSGKRRPGYARSRASGDYLPSRYDTWGHQV